MVDDAENGDEDGLNGDMTIEENLPDESEGGEDGVGKEDTEELSGESLDM